MAKDDEIRLTSLTVADLAAMLATAASNTVAQTSQQVAQQTAQQIADQLARAVGQLQSDLASRTIVMNKADTDIGMDERIRSTGAGMDAAWQYKTNISDFLIGTQNIANQATNQNQLARMIEGSINHYNAVLSDERIAKDRTNYYTGSKIQQEQRHADIASERQWDTNIEVAKDAIAKEIVDAVTANIAARKI